MDPYFASYYAAEHCSQYFCRIWNGCVFLLCSLPAFIFLNKKSQKVSKSIEYASALWTIAMYVTLGGGPMISKIFFIV